METFVMPLIRMLLRASSLTAAVQAPVEQAMTVLYQLLWVFPAYFVSFLVSCSWYTEIADRAYTMHFGRQKEEPPDVAGFVKRMGDEAWRFLLTYSFLLQTHIVLYCVPYVGWVLHLVHLAWYWAFFCFEYKWALHGWTTEQRIAALEEQWLFLGGFGLPLALLSSTLPTFVSYGIMAFLFPLFVVLATVSEPRVHKPSRLLPRRLPLFQLPKRLSLWTVQRLNRRLAGSQGAAGGQHASVPRAATKTHAH
mmetsp:Transcript_20807/g.61542  ORF Transcript_20807/g.61542 Transcript_20807/m.61542 type:complete len:251 (+) Transcript_20807:146-898(+)